MSFWEEFSFWITFVSRFFTIGAAGIAIWVFIFKREKVSNALNMLTGYAIHVSARELLEKVRQLNNYSKPNPDQEVEIWNKDELLDLLATIRGYIEGNKYVRSHLEEELRSISKYLRSPETLNRLKNRSLANQLEQKLLTLEVDILEKQNN